MNQALLAAILEYGDRHRREFVLKNRPEPGVQEELLQDWWSALDFFWARAFYQGRRDKVSERIEAAAKQVLNVHHARAHGDLQAFDLDALKQELQQHIGLGKVGKSGDVKMVISALRFAGGLPGHNLVAYSVGRVSTAQIEQHHIELQHTRNPTGGIVQVGPKIAALYLRDVVSLFHLDAHVPDAFQFCLQPVDTWVRQLAARLDLVQEKASDPEIQQAIIQLCREHAVSPLQFNKGLWYVGTHALDLLLAQLQQQTVAP